MFYLRRKQLLHAIKDMRKMVCVYLGSDDRCDCKYGYRHMYDSSWRTEQRGCPELRNVAHILEVMTDEEYENFLARYTDNVEFSSYRESKGEK